MDGKKTTSKSGGENERIAVSESNRIRQSLEKLFKKSQQLREDVNKKEEEASKLKSAISKQRKDQEKGREKGEPPPSEETPSTGTPE